MKAPAVWSNTYFCVVWRDIKGIEHATSDLQIKNQKKRALKTGGIQGEYRQEYKGNPGGVQGEYKGNTKGIQGEYRQECKGNTGGIQGEYKGNTGGIQGEYKGNTQECNGKTGGKSHLDTVAYSSSHFLRFKL